MPTLSPARTGGRRSLWSRGLHVGIEIGSEAISVVTVGGRLRRTIGQAIYRPYGDVVRPQQLDASALVRLVTRELPRRSDNVRRPATVCLPPSLGLTRIVQASNAEKALEEVQQSMDADSCDVVWSLPNPGSFVVHTVAADLIEGAATAIDSLGYDCTAALPHPLAVWQCRHLARDSCSAVLDWGLDACTLVTGSGNQIGVVRQLPGCELLTAVEKAATDPAEVQRWIAALRSLAATTPCLPDMENESAGNRRQLERAQRHFRSRIGHVANEVRQTLVYGSRFGVPKAERLFVTGLGAFLLGPEFEEATGLRLVPAANQVWGESRREAASRAGRRALLSKAAAIGLYCEETPLGKSFHAEEPLT